MGLSKRSKVSAEFSMSSLTDIIFLLLIFFMLTSSMIQINMELPKSDSTTIAPTDYTVMLTNDGKVKYNNQLVAINRIENLIRQDYKLSENQKNATVAIVSEVGVPWKSVSEVMAIANRLKMRAIIATQPRK